jgi:hypothetical protein
MTTEADARWSQRTFRAGTSYDLVLFERLAPAEQAALAELRLDPDFYGVLKPRPGTGRTIRVVGQETALLWLTLQSPGPLPFFALASESKATAKAIVSLVLDGIIEFEDNGRFVSGAEALESIDEESRLSSEGPAGRLALFSEAALRYGEVLRLDDSRALAGRLYGFGRQPLTPRWRKALASREALMAFIGAEAGSEGGKRLTCDWAETTSTSMPGWLAWSNRLRRRAPRPVAPLYKLYVSPDINFMPQAFAAVLGVASRGALSFKIGADAAGLLRPDKMVLYFPDKESLFQVASDIAALIKEAPAHGVPFSAEITGDGLLSWGMDPPESERVVAWQEPESWRLWVVRRLAAAMIAAQTEPSGSVPPRRFAVERLRLEGVDVDRWTPSASVWSSN